MTLHDLKKPLSGDKCILCGGTPFCIGIFIPEHPQQWGSPADKSRFVRYCLCEKCKAKNDTPDKVEKVILAELSGGGITHAE